MPPRRRQRKHSASALASSSLGNFFARYHPRFDYNASNSASHEFYRLCDEFGWDKDDPKRKDAHCNFKNALVKQFNGVYGMDKEDVRNWQNLCHIVKIDPVPGDLHACREAVRGIFVNLVDLVDAGNTGKDVHTFKSELRLSEYTKDTGKFFPRKHADAGGFLQYLLRHIHQPRKEVPPRRRTKKRR